MFPATQVCKRVGLPRGTPLRAYEEVKPLPRPRLDSIVTDKPIGSHPDIQDGDIVILEQALSEVQPETDADLSNPLIFSAMPSPGSCHVCNAGQPFTLALFALSTLCVRLCLLTQCGDA